LSEQFDKFKGRFVRLPVANQIFFIKAGVLYRYAVNFMKTPINGIAPIAIRVAIVDATIEVSD
jgi:hypothetical protein